MVMQRVTHPSFISLLSEHVEAWRRDSRMSRESIADLIVSAHEEMDGASITGIRFEPKTTDTFERMRVNADRIFRWLDDRSKDKNLLPPNMLWAVLSAMPMDRRILCVNDLLHPVGIEVSTYSDHGAEPSHDQIVMHFQALVEHGAASTLATSALLDGVHPGEAEAAAKKLGLLAATVRRARGLMARLRAKKGG